MNAIVSITSDWAIGRDNRLLVRNKDDMRRFVQLTTGGTVIMGRKTFESLPGGPLKNRRNIVVTHSNDYVAHGVEVVSSPEKALVMASDDDPDAVWLIGGESIYKALLPYCERAYVTKHEASLAADAFFPNLDADPNWLVESLDGTGVTESDISYSFVTYRRA